MQFARQRTLQAVDPIVSFVVSIALAAAGAGYWAFVLGTLAGVWSSAIVSVLACPYPLRLRLDRATTRQYVTFSAPLLAASVGGIVVAQGTVLAGQAVAGLAAAGAITLAASITAFTNKVDDVLSHTLYPAICAVQDQPKVLFETFVKSNRLALMWAMPFGLGLTLFAPDLVDHVLGDRWDGATELLQAFGFAAAIGHLGFNWNSYFMARGETRPVMVASLVSAAAFLTIHLPLILAEGVRGVWIGMVILVLIGLVVRGVYLQRLFAGFALGRHALRAVWPSVPAVVAVLLARAAGAGAVPELALYVVVTLVTTVVAERPLIVEALGYLKRRRPVTT
jgi:PST family polysaccharide transporter